MIYVIGSLKNEKVPLVAEELRKCGYRVFDDWYSAGPEADDYWQAHCRLRGMDYEQALASPHAVCVFEFDREWLDAADTVVLVLPAGKSGHIELGYAIGAGKRGFILLDGEPDRYDVMYKFATGVAFTVGDLIELVSE